MPDSRLRKTVRMEAPPLTLLLTLKRFAFDMQRRTTVKVVVVVAVIIAVVVVVNELLVLCMDIVHRIIIVTYAMQ